MAESNLELNVPKTTFENGATRSAQKLRYDLITPSMLEALARRLALGAERHSERGWEKGGDAFEQATISHLMGHLTSYQRSPNQEDADAIICNAGFLTFFQERRELRAKAITARDLRAGMCGCSLTDNGRVWMCGLLATHIEKGEPHSFDDGRIRMGVLSAGYTGD